MPGSLQHFPRPQLDFRDHLVARKERERTRRDGNGGYRVQEDMERMRKGWVVVIGKVVPLFLKFLDPPDPSYALFSLIFWNHRIKFFPQHYDCFLATGYQLLKILVAKLLACSALSCTLLASLQLQLAVKFCRFTTPATCSHLGRYGRALFFLQGIKMPSILKISHSHLIL